MQLRRKTSVVAVALLALLPATSLADLLGMESEDQNAQYLFRFFADADRVHVVSHYAFYDVTLENDVDFAVHVNHEAVTIPAVEAPPGSDEAIDAVTTASRPIRGADAFQDFTKVRNEVQASAAYGGLDLGYYVSTESDYFAQQAAAEYSLGLDGENLVLTGGLSYGWDRIEPDPDADTATPDDHRNTVHGHFVVTRVLTATTLLRVGGEMNKVEGLQHNPYRNVYAGGGPAPELHPGERLRRDVFVRLNQYVANGSSVKLAYRYYTDDWGIDSHELGAKLHQHVGEWVDVRYRYRYYQQTAADFYRAEYETADGIDGYRTGDYRMRDLTSHLFGSRIDLDLGVFAPESRWLSAFEIGFGYERYFNDANFSANVFESGLHFEF
ncbi:MAG: DUF3570 domain-containing protein [Candidatus Eisenbacteria bacterium]